MEQITVEMEKCLYESFKKLGTETGRTAEQVMRDVLTRFVDEVPFRKRETT